MNLGMITRVMAITDRKWYFSRDQHYMQVTDSVNNELILSHQNHDLI